MLVSSSLISLALEQEGEESKTSLMIGNIQVIDCYNHYLDPNNNGIIYMK